jgi:uncharacterized protein YndB with AHSA1/START domain
MVADRIEQEILIATSVERVWAVLTEADHIGNWFGTGIPAKVELRPGGSFVVDHGRHGPLIGRVEEVEPPRRLTYRLSQSPSGEEPASGNATLVEFTLHPAPGGTRLSVVESGFAELEMPADYVATRERQNSANWPGKLEKLREYSQQLVP